MEESNKILTNKEAIIDLANDLINAEEAYLPFSVAIDFAERGYYVKRKNDIEAFTIRESKRNTFVIIIDSKQGKIVRRLQAFTLDEVRANDYVIVKNITV